MKLDKNPLKIKSMFDEIALHYDRTNDLISFKTHYLIKVLSVKILKIKPKSNILDLCSGTGDFVKIISKLHPDCSIKGLDNSEKMLKFAKEKNPNKEFILADCTDIPFEDNEFDYITMGFGLRNIKKRELALKEIYRILKNRGQFLHLDFGEHNFLSSVFNFTTSLFIKFFIKNKEAYKYLIASKNDFIKTDKLVYYLKKTRFKEIRNTYFLFRTICATTAQK